MSSSTQTRNRILSAHPCKPEEVLNVRSDSPEKLLSMNVTIDPSCAYGCVDWFLYPDPTGPDLIRKGPST